MPADSIQGFRLSPQQKHVWLLQEEHHVPYRMHGAILIEGPLHTETLALALTKIVQRHEILRTTFPCPPGMTLPLQVIAESRISWRHDHDLRALEHLAQEDKVDRLVQAANLLPINLAQDPALSVTLMPLSPRRHILLLSLPALCADTASLSNLTQELSQAYAACVDHQELSDEPLQYADFADWHNALLASEDAAAGKEYWRKQNIASLLGVKLPFETRSRSQASFHPQWCTSTLPPELWSNIEALTQQYATTTAAFLLACWQVLLWRLTRESALVIGVAHARRNYQELEQALGLFAAYLPMPGALQDDCRFSTVLQDVHRSLQEVAEWQEYFSWEDIGEGCEQNLGPCFPHFSFDFTPQSTQYAAADVAFSVYKHYACIDRFKVKLSCTLQDHCLITELHYDDSLFDKDDIKRLASYFQTLLECVSHNPEAAIGEIEILNHQERQQLVVAFNNTASSAPHEQCFHHVFQEQVKRTPDRIAVIYDDQQLTYAELNQRANQLAHHLQTVGVGPEILVGVYMERSLEMIVGVLGVFKAGGAYVPLDPTYPQDRLAFILDDAHVSVLLTQQHLTGSLPWHTAEVLCLDADWETIAQHVQENPFSLAGPEHLAYVIYTSGSTGQPKGVSVEHRAPMNLLNGLYNTIYAHHPVSLLHASLNAPLSFDASMQQLLLLLHGHTLSIIPQAIRVDGEAFLAYLERHALDVLDCTPSQLRVLLTAGLLDGAGPVPALVLVAGEAIEEHMWHTLTRTSRARFYNIYGPTECTVDATACLIQATSEYPTIGHPLANYQVYVLDQQLAPVPIYVPGELYIGGAGLARGYLARYGLTAEKFIPNPFQHEPGARLYKTGDVARYLPDGNLEFLGRLDHQVKIRGFRIELEEIEAVLAQHPAVREAVLLAQHPEPGAGDMRLVAYVLFRPEQTSTSSELRDFLRQKLPDYMVPAVFVPLDTLPLTPSGKIDRQALPAPETVATRLHSAHVAPRHPIEEMLTDIWGEVLHVKQVGVYDDFFALGGHSLLATQLVSRICRALQIDLPLRSLFNFPNVASLAAYIEAAQRQGRGLLLPPLHLTARHGEIPLSFAQQRLWFLEQLEPGNHAYNIPGALHVKGPLNVTVLAQSLRATMQRHEALRTTFAEINGQPSQVIAPSAAWTLLVIDLRHVLPMEQETTVQRLTTAEARRPFNLTKGPLLRATLLQLGEADSVLLLTMHHIVSDGWSMGVLVREVLELYMACSSARPMPLPELSIQYADFVHWQRAWLQGEVLEALLAYWKQQLRNVPLVLQLPTDRPRPTVQTFRGAVQSLTLLPPLLEALKALSRQAGVTLFMTLLAAFQTLLARYTGQDDIVVGSPIANRTRAETEPLIGLFVNTLVLRTPLAGNPRFRTVLERVREMALSAYAHQDLPFERLVEAVQPARDLSHTPLFQVMLVLQNAPMPALRLPDLTLSPVEVHSGTAKFDLTLLLVDTEEGLKGTFEYNSDLFDAATIRRMAGHFQTLLEGIVVDPEQGILDLPLLTKDERHQLLGEWNGHQAEDAQDLCLHTMFELQVERTPDAVAVVCGDAQLTYRELNCRANQLAHHLRALDVGPEVLVALCMERSLEMVVGLLGILKAGGAYVPLDPSYPQERLAFMLEDAQARVLLTQQQLVEELPTCTAHVICLDTDWAAVARESTENPTGQVIMRHLAYVIYTSGSTGRPKGVAIEHRSTVALLHWARDLFTVEDLAGVLASTSICFDLSVFEIFVPLSVGGKVIVADNVLQLSTLPAAACISLLNTVPSAAAQLLRMDGLPASVHTVNLAGEPLQNALVQQLYEQETVQQVFNLYGPTEGTTYSTFTLVQQGASSAPSIGRAIANSQLYVLDTQMQPVPVGVPGELYLGGAGLARGYLNRPALTAEKFILHPFSDVPGARLYKTGDLARYLPDGNVQFLGRFDHQVKLRGYRIELGEIETVLHEHPAVSESVVTVVADGTGEQRLVAYLVTNQNSTLNASALNHFLSMKLPRYMIPSSFVTLDTLPLTPNGKIDRRALPAPDQDILVSRAAYTAPRTPVEEMLAAVWAEVLNVERVSIHDNFFELGGHSLLATQVISWIRHTYEIELPLHDFFAFPTVAGMAVVITQSQAKKMQHEDLGDMMAALEGLSDQEARRLLGEEST